MMTTRLTKELFSPHRGEIFRLHAGGDAPVEVELTEVSGLDSDKPRPFSLVFAGPSEPTLPQGTYRLDHDRLGTLELFLVPIGPDPANTRLQYEAVFN